MSDGHRATELERWICSGAIGYHPATRLLTVLWLRWGRLRRTDDPVQECEVWPSYGTICDALGMHERTMRRAMRVLEEAGAIRKAPGRRSPSGKLHSIFLQPCPHDEPGAETTKRTRRNAGKGVPETLPGPDRRGAQKRTDGAHPPAGHTGPAKTDRRGPQERTDGAHLTTHEPPKIHEGPPWDTPQNPSDSVAGFVLTHPEPTPSAPDVTPEQICGLMRQALRWAAGSGGETIRGPNPAARGTRKMVTEVQSRELASLDDWRRVISAQAWSVRGRPSAMRYLSLGTLHRRDNWSRALAEGQALPDSSVCPWERQGPQAAPLEEGPAPF